MECIATSYAPLIVEPDSANDWTKQHVLSEQLRQAEHKQPTTTNNNLSTSSTITTTITTKRLSAAHPPLPSKRQRTQNNNHLLLHIPGPTSRVHKYVVTPTKTPTKSPQEWAALLHSATQTLQSIYANNNNNMLAAPAAPRRAPMAERPEFEGLDRVQLASRAMQMAAGFHHAADSSDDGEYSSASESEVEAPATPMGVGEGVMMDIDPQLFS